MEVAIIFQSYRIPPVGPTAARGTYLMVGLLRMFDRESKSSFMVNPVIDGASLQVLKFPLDHYSKLLTSRHSPAPIISGLVFFYRL